MIGIDTNVLVRYLVKDDEKQFALAQTLITEALATGQPVMISMLVSLETEWVLRSLYKISKPQIASVLARLLESKDVVFEDEECLEEALYHWNGSQADFADCLIVAKNRRLGCSSFFTFDTKAGKLAGATMLAN